MDFSVFGLNYYSSNTFSSLLNEVNESFWVKTTKLQLNWITYGNYHIKNSEYLSRSADLSLNFCFNARFPPSWRLCFCQLLVLVIDFVRIENFTLSLWTWCLWFHCSPSDFAYIQGLFYWLIIHHSLRWSKVFSSKFKCKQTSRNCWLYWWFLLISNKSWGRHLGSKWCKFSY